VAPHELGMENTPSIFHSNSPNSIPFHPKKWILCDRSVAIHGLLQGVTPRWKSVHRVSGYRGYQPDIKVIIIGYQEKIDQISVEYLTDFSRLLKSICSIYLNNSYISVDNGQGEKKKTLKNC